ncbi:MAG: hypothetical protein HY332_03740 [Chloroflexi bacterium]|nr:hypothetical protein [Chloroflexota bacterium]
MFWTTAIPSSSVHREVGLVAGRQLARLERAERAVGEAAQPDRRVVTGDGDALVGPTRTGRAAGAWPNLGYDGVT